MIVTLLVQNVAPVITVFDHRGCDRANLEYQGAKANGEDDYMCVKIKAEVRYRMSVGCRCQN